MACALHHEIEARALAHFTDDPNDSLLTQAWVAAVRSDPSLERLLGQLFGRRCDAQRRVRPTSRGHPRRRGRAARTREPLVASCPLHRCERTRDHGAPARHDAPCKPQLDASAFALLMRARDAGALAEDAAWFTSTPAAGWDRTLPLLSCTEATQKAVVAYWLEAGTNLHWVAKFDFEGAAREAILRADLNAISALFSKDRMNEWMPLLREHIRASKDADGVLTRLQYSGPSSAALENLRKLALGDETPSMRIQRLLDAVKGPKKTMTFFFEPQALTLDVGEEARTTYVRIDAPEGEDAIVTIAIEDVPELQAKYREALSLTVFGKRGKNAAKVITRIALHECASAEHQALQAAPKRLRASPSTCPKISSVTLPADATTPLSTRRARVALHRNAALPLPSARSPCSPFETRPWWSYKRTRASSWCSRLDQAVIATLEG